MNNLAEIFKSNPELVPLNTVLLEAPKGDDAIVLSAPGKGLGWANEREFARAVANRRDELAIIMPELKLMYHIPNENSHHEPGVVAGIPDWCLPVARGRWHSMYIELKAGKGKLRRNQIDVMHALGEEGHYCVTVWDSVDAVFRHIMAYLALGKREGER